LDVVVVRKLALPWNPEAGFGAVAVDGTTVLNPQFLERVRLDPEAVEGIKARELEEAARRDRIYRADRPFPPLTGYSVILIDDGLASGYTMFAAVEFAKKSRPREVVVASPVASGAAVELLQPRVDRVVVLHVSHRWNFAVASFYQDFAQLTDEEVVTTLRGSQTEATHGTT
jgi:predicted phosphoribosyltransferase